MATTHYIDFSAGLDSNNGTAKATPWKHHPYMQGWTGSYSHAAGDEYIFKGGVTWDNTCFGGNQTTAPVSANAFIMQNGGSAGNVDYFGVDMTWFTGGSWSQPVWDGGYISSIIVVMAGQSYITFDNLEIKRVSMGYYNYLGLFEGFGMTHVTIQNCNLHGWQLATSQSLLIGPNGGIVGGVQFYDNTSTYGNNLLSNCQIHNEENTYSGTGVITSNTAQCGEAVRGVSVISGCSIHDVGSAVVFCSTINNTSIYNVSYPNSNNGFDFFYQFNIGWQAQLPYFAGTPGSIIFDNNGNFQWCTVAGTSGSSTPSWNATLHGTTTDGTVTWKNVAIGTFNSGSANCGYPPGVARSTAYLLGDIVQDTVGTTGTSSATGTCNFIQCTSPGTTSGTAPTWTTTLGGSTTDGGVTWAMVGSQVVNGAGNSRNVLHTNGIYFDSVGSSSTGSCFDNILYNIAGGANCIYPNPHGQTLYVYNNLIYGHQSAQLAIEVDPLQFVGEGGGTCYVLNNTVVNFTDNSPAIHVNNRNSGSVGPSGAVQVNLLVIENNHVIYPTTGTLTDATTTGAGPVGNGGSVATLTTLTNLLQTASAAAAQGYVLGNFYAPTSGGSTIQAGTSQSSIFTTDINGVARGANWDIGCYQYVSGVQGPPSGPIMCTGVLLV